MVETPPFRGMGAATFAELDVAQSYLARPPYPQALFEALRRRRSELAKEQQVAAYVVFADKTLIDMARRKPATVTEMGAVHGVGAAKLRQYGELFLDVIRQHAAGQL